MEAMCSFAPFAAAGRLKQRPQPSFGRPGAFRVDNRTAEDNI
jgi:hypothetical protein